MQTILDRHSEVEILPETKLFAWLWSPWRSLRRRPAQEVLRGVGQSIDKINRAWSQPENRELLERLQHGKLSAPERFSSVAEVMDYVLRTCPQEGTTRVGEKTPLHIYHVEALLQFFPNAKIVVMRRDLRGAYFSQASRAAEGQLSYRSFRGLLFVAAWRHAEVLAERFLQVYGDRKVHHVSYEALVAEPEREVRSLCEFLNLRFEPSMLEVPAGNSSFEGGVSGISSHAASRWQQELTPELAEELAYLGSPYLDQSERKSSPSPKLRILRLLLQVSDALVFKFPELICYLARDSRYRKFSNV